MAFLHQEAGINYLHERRNVHILNFAYKRKNNPNSVTMPRRETRLFTAIVLRSPKSVYHKCAKGWNALPADERNILIYEKFKIRQKYQLQDNRANYNGT